MRYGPILAYHSPTDEAATEEHTDACNYNPSDSSSGTPPRAFQHADYAVTIWSATSTRTTHKLTWASGNYATGSKQAFPWRNLLAVPFEFSVLREFVRVLSTASHTYWSGASADSIQGKTLCSPHCILLDAFWYPLSKSIAPCNSGTSASASCGLPPRATCPVDTQKTSRSAAVFPVSGRTAPAISIYSGCTFASIVGPGGFLSSFKDALNASDLEVINRRARARFCTTTELLCCRGLVLVGLWPGPDDSERLYINVWDSRLTLLRAGGPGLHGLAFTIR